MKGACRMKTKPYRRWADIFKAWIKTNHQCIVLHCDTSSEMTNARMAAQRYSKKYGVQFRTLSDTGRVYIFREDYVTGCAMEVRQEKGGAIFFYDDSTKAL